MKKLIPALLFCALVLGGCSSNSNNSTGIMYNTPREGSSSSSSSTSSSSQVADNVAEFEPGVHADVEVDRNAEIIVIGERLFVAQTNDIYINAEDYLGKTIQYEGIFKVMDWPEMGKTYYFVIRYGPGCCGYDGEAGFEVAWDGEWPEEDDWVEAIGTLEILEENGLRYLVVNLSSLTVKEERGAEYVYM